MIAAPVGHQCPDCVAQGLAQTRQNVLPYGGRRSADPRQTTLAIIGINLAVWLGIVVTGGANSWVYPLLALSRRSMCEVGGGYFALDRAGCTAQGGSFLPGLDSGAWWQLVTNAFAHVDLIHIGFNMVALWFLGPILERALGRARFLAVYFGSVLTASALVVVASDPYDLTLGASGAVFGLLGALIILAVKARGDVRTLLMWLGLNLAITFYSGASISWQGHVGGLIGGLAIMLLLVAIDPRKAERLQWVAIGGVAGAALVVSVAGGLLL